jgi:hypothetical protein
MNWDIFILNFLCASWTDRSSVSVPRLDISHYVTEELVPVPTLWNNDAPHAQDTLTPVRNGLLERSQGRYLEALDRDNRRNAASFPSPNDNERSSIQTRFPLSPVNNSNFFSRRHILRRHNVTAGDRPATARQPSPPPCPTLGRNVTAGDRPATARQPSPPPCPTLGRNVTAGDRPATARQPAPPQCPTPARSVTAWDRSATAS